MTASPTEQTEQEKRTAKARLGLADRTMRVEITSNSTWAVTNGDGDAYTVANTTDGWTCTCPDWQHHCCKQGLRCKHIEAVRMRASSTMSESTAPGRGDDAMLIAIALALATPFPASVINWKPQAVSKDKTRALAVAYIDARDVMARLDEAVGPFNWQVKHEQSGEQPVTGLGIKHPVTGEWVWKYDVGFVGGSESKDDDEQMKAIKGTASDGLKRAAVAWGIGRYLYSLPKTWVEFDAEKRQLKTTPILPLWAIPESDRNPGRANGNGRAKGHKAASASPTTPAGNEAALNQALQIVIPEGAVAGKKLGEVDHSVLTAIASDKYKPITTEGQACKQAAALILSALPAPTF